MKTLIAVLTLLATIVVAGDNKAEPEALTAARDLYLEKLVFLSEQAPGKEPVAALAYAAEIAAVRKLAVGSNTVAQRAAAMLPGTWKLKIGGDKGKLFQFWPDGRISPVENPGDSRGSWRVMNDMLYLSLGDKGACAVPISRVSESFSVTTDQKKSLNLVKQKEK